MMIELSKIRIDGNTQPREKIDTATVSEYAELSMLPAIVLYQDGANLWLADGFHRYHAALHRGDTTIEADVRKGDVRMARWHAIGANIDHGLRRSVADKRKAVLLALEDSEWAKKSDRQIGSHIGVSHTFVSDTRKSLTSGNVATGGKASVSKTTGRGAKTGSVVKDTGHVFNTSTMKLEHAMRSEPPPDDDDEPVASDETPVPEEIEIKDGRGTAVSDPDLRQVFTRSHEIGKLAAQVSSLKAHVASFKGDSMFSEIRFQKADTDLKNVIANIKAAFPYCQCPYMPNCERGACTACKGKKWITESQWNQVPEEIRGSA